MREPGYYWVKHNGRLRIAQTIGDPGPEFWALCLDAKLYYDEDFEWISTDRVEPPEGI